MVGTGHPHEDNNELLMLRNLPDIQSNDVLSQGYLEESLWQDVFEYTGGSTKYSEVWMYSYREMGGTLFADGTVVQSYVQIENPDDVGFYLSVACTATYMKNDSVSKTVDIQNYYGYESITVADKPNVKWNELASTKIGKGGFVKETEHERYSY